MGVTACHARRVGRALELSGCITTTREGRLSLTELVPAVVISSETHLSPAESSGGCQGAASRKVACGEHMPRANTGCFLGRGHKGHHRSKP